MVDYPTIADYPNATGAMPLLYSIRDGIPFAFSALLLTIFLAISVTNYFINLQKNGRGKILQALLVGSFIMIPLSSLLALAQLVSFMAVLFWAFLSIVLLGLNQLTTNY